MQNKTRISVFELALFGIYGAMMVASKYLAEILPNVHPLAMFTVLFTVVYRAKALIPIYVFVFLSGLWAGFSIWWVPYLYLWTILWAVAMLIPKNISKWLGYIVYPIICALHGFLYGILYAPFQAIIFHYSMEQTVTWLIAGIPYDVLHGISNFAMGFLVWPLAQVIRKAHKYVNR